MPQHQLYIISQTSAFSIETDRSSSEKFKMAFLKYMKGAIVGNEEPKFEVLSKTDDYELRSYTECRWVTLSIHDKTPEEFSRDEFKRLFDYINGKNETGISIEMTIPMVYHVSPVEEKAKDYSVSFFLPAVRKSAKSVRY
ncbi:heme-binding protein 1 [Caerostris darwini]|uniref:Heme-binding protein 1 n=1 Tax=Caerostris darwini TaxID=1538125 RepID=A0AAV4W9L7_9ARAC|nr:heme-binding protein 1 [Caerostris darwini]